MKTELPALMFLLTLGTTTAVPVLNPATGHYYDIVTKPISWADAKTEAENTFHQGQRGHLATVTSQAESTFIAATFPQVTASLRIGGYYLGGHQVDTTGGVANGWQWVTGEPWVFTKWAPGEPNDFQGGPENFLTIHDFLTANPEALWNDAASFSSSGYIIEFDPPPLLLTCPANIVVGAGNDGTCSAAVSFPDPVPSGGYGTVSVVCSAPSGSVFQKGITTVFCTATDSIGQQATCLFTVEVLDTTGPVISVAGGDVASVECGSLFIDPGATALDSCDGATTVSSAGFLDTATPGTYSITYSASDASGNASTATRTVHVVDTLPPGVVLNGANPLTIECHSAFVDPGATANDTCSGALAVTAAGVVDVNSPGTYLLTYTATDSFGNSQSVTRTVVVRDSNAPVITLNGPNPLLVLCGEPFVDPGATASDDCAGAVPVTTSGTVDVNTPGDYTLTYSAIDQSGNAATATRLVSVEDCAVLVMTCPADIVLPADAGQCSARVTYNDPLVTGGTGPVTITCDPPSGSNFPAGVSSVTCTATDARGQQTTCRFTVTVEDSEAPSLICPPDLTVACVADVPAADFAGGSVIDDCDPAVVVVHIADEQSGTNPLVITRTYEATDASGNSVTCEQIITVVGLVGDFNDDCCVDRTDLNTLTARIRARTNDLTFDVNSDGVVNIADARALVLLFTNPGGAPCP